MAVLNESDRALLDHLRKLAGIEPAAMLAYLDPTARANLNGGTVYAEAFRSVQAVLVQAAELVERLSAPGADLAFVVAELRGQVGRGLADDGATDPRVVLRSVDAQLAKLAASLPGADQ